MADFHIALNNTYAEVLKSTELASKAVGGTDLSALAENARMSIRFPAATINQFITDIDNIMFGRDEVEIFVFPILKESRITVRAGSPGISGYIDATEVSSPDLSFLADLAGLHNKGQGILRKVPFKVNEIRRLINDPLGNLTFHLTSLSYKDDPKHHFTFSAVFEDEQGTPDTEGLTSALPCPPNCGPDNPYENRGLQIVKL